MDIERRSIPTKLDQLPKGSICRVNLYEEDTCVMYIQVSEDEFNPRWEPMVKN